MRRADRHPNLDFFVADLWAWMVKDDLASMEHPFFSLSKKRDLTVYHYEHNGNAITIAPSVYGHPTIWDKDVLIYCSSQLIAGMKEGRAPQQIVHLTAHDLLVSTNRATNNLGYDRLKAAFNRLTGVIINTDIKTGGIRVQQGFGLLEWWRIIKDAVKPRRLRPGI